MKFLRWVSFLICLGASLSAHADRAVFTPAQEAAFIQQYSHSLQLSPAYIRATLAEAEFQEKSYAALQPKISTCVTCVVPTPAQAWQSYRGRFISPTRVILGDNFARAHRATLQKALKRYGVSPFVIVAVLGIESDYGHYPGSFNMLNVLATLAFNVDRRQAFFQKELAQFLVICSKNHLDPTEIRSSIDGGFGFPQFMPSSYLAYAVSATPGVPPDLFNPDDAILSVANYLHREGWQTGRPIAYSATYAPRTCLRLTCNEEHPLYPAARWLKEGVVVAQHVPSHRLASLNFLGPVGHAPAWLTFQNFLALYRYNQSYYYILTINDLSHALAAEWSKHS